MQLTKFNKKIKPKELYENLLVLDSDEGLRIENSKNGEKIFINRNLFGTYCILVRIEKNIEKSMDEEIIDREYTEQFFNYNEITLVLDFIKKQIKEFDVWTY